MSVSVHTKCRDLTVVLVGFNVYLISLLHFKHTVEKKHNSMTSIDYSERRTDIRIPKHITTFVQNEKKFKGGLPWFLDCQIKPSILGNNFKNFLVGYSDFVFIAIPQIVFKSSLTNILKGLNLCRIP